MCLAQGPQHSDAGEARTLLLPSAEVVFKIHLQKILSEILPECQMVWIQIRADIMSVLMWHRLSADDKSGSWQRNQVILISRYLNFGLQLFALGNARLKWITCTFKFFQITTFIQL